MHGIIFSKEWGLRSKDWAELMGHLLADIGPAAVVVIVITLHIVCFLLHTKYMSLLQSTCGIANGQLL